jgi:hypothetical protein
MTCQTLQVFFDRPISLKQEPRDKQAAGPKEQAKVHHLVCDKSARVEDQEYDDKGRLLRYQQLRGPLIAYDNKEEQVRGYGPGELRLMQKGGSGDGAGGVGGPPSRSLKPGPAPATGATPKPPARGKDDDQMKLTYVSFDRQMFGDKQKNLAVFYVNVRVLNYPCDDLGEARGDIDLDEKLKGRLPEGAMYLRSDRLVVRQRPRPGEQGKFFQEMDAQGRVIVQSNEFTGRAESVKYDEEKDQVIFDGGNSGVAELYKAGTQGQEPERIEGRKIIYSRKTGRHWGDGIRSIKAR